MRFSLLASLIFALFMVVASTPLKVEKLEDISGGKIENLSLNIKKSLFFQMIVMDEALLAACSALHNFVQLAALLD